MDAMPWAKILTRGPERHSAYHYWIFAALSKTHHLHTHMAVHHCMPSSPSHSLQQHRGHPSALEHENLCTDVIISSRCLHIVLGQMLQYDREYVNRKCADEAGLLAV